MDTISFKPAAEAPPTGLATALIRDHMLRPVYRNYVLAMITVGFTLNFLDRQILSILMQPIKLELHLSDTAWDFYPAWRSRSFTRLSGFRCRGLPIAARANASWRCR
jgi:hypothetical protein